MHGSLLPQYRGRAPVNWAVLHGERETGATLHYMTAKPDARRHRRADGRADPPRRHGAGGVRQGHASPPKSRSTACCPRSSPAPRRACAQDPAAGSYFGGRRPEDGIIDWNRDAATIHNLVRAVAPPYPGAFTTVGGVAARVLRTRVVATATPPTLTPTLEARDGRLFAHCGGGGTLAVLALEIDGNAVDATTFAARFGSAPVSLGDTRRS